jgi:hypothetical protein
VLSNRNAISGSDTSMASRAGATKTWGENCMRVDDPLQPICAALVKMTKLLAA